MKIEIGCDIVALKRIEKAMQKPGFTKILTPREYEKFCQFQGKRQIEWLAGRFAAKEAVIKAIHKKTSATIAEIESLCDEAGAP